MNNHSLIGFSALSVVKTHHTRVGTVVLLILIPILGYIQSSAYEFSSGVNFFFFDLPEIIPKNKTIFDTANFLHKWLSYFFVAVLSAHILGAVKHRLFDKENDVLERMM